MQRVGLPSLAAALHRARRHQGIQYLGGELVVRRERETRRLRPQPLAHKTRSAFGRHIEVDGSGGHHGGRQSASARGRCLLLRQTVLHVDDGPLAARGRGSGKRHRGSAGGQDARVPVARGRAIGAEVRGGLRGLQPLRSSRASRHPPSAGDDHGLAPESRASRHGHGHGGRSAERAHRRARHAEQPDAGGLPAGATSGACC
mmetsp:Transcript_126139/g.365087  ORF Transcript_126139/g.365087 Transcript_126139/m.365087 type:complete len:202 (-) Transcript_126139:234-839(-)